MKFLRPHKLKDLRKEPIVIAMHVEKYLQENRGRVKLQDLIDFLKRRLKINEEKIVFGLNFLYILGKLEYKKDTDEVRRKV